MPQMPAIYSPPYDSPIEDSFALHYVKYASPSIELLSQSQVTTLCGLFILDFVIQYQSGYRVAIECDGKEYHDESRDEWRDAMILGEHHVDAIYRIRGSDIHYYIEDVLYLLAELEPGAFSERAVSNLKVLASPEIQRYSKSHEQDHYQFQYRNGSDTGSFNLEVRRRIVPQGTRRFWQAAYRYAVSVGGGQLDEVIGQYRSKWSGGN
jgi:hypothetical protein